ncbi:MAG: metalloregulator ArsR/SmtB family transcription factor [Actinobacteria bacterium]|nr:metalloregulator ArsR/SmtB family transcription factor [Actinomycetota bacterium]
MKKIIKILKALSDENRLRIVCLLFHKSGLCVCEIQRIISLSQPTISFDLKKLEEAEIITYSKSGLWVNYAINENFDTNLKNIINMLVNEIKNDKKIKEDLKKAEKVSRLEICKK